MIFPVLFVDKKAQIDELVRFDASETKGAITAGKVIVEGNEINFTESQINSGKLFVDWIFKTAGLKSVRFEFQGPEDADVYIEKTIAVLSADDEKLFNSDDDLVAYESKIRSWIPEGRSTWNFVHREVKKIVLEEVSSRYGTRIDSDKILNLLQFREWAKFKALEMIFRGINNTESDVFSSKAEFYGKEAGNYRILAFNHLEVDVNGDGKVEDKEVRRTLGIEVYR